MTHFVILERKGANSGESNEDLDSSSPQGPLHPDFGDFDVTSLTGSVFNHSQQSEAAQR